MAKVFRRIIKGILLKGETSDPNDNINGSVWHNSTSNRFKAYLESAIRILVTENQTQTLSNKTVDNSNSITVQDTNLTVQDNSDNTKQAKLELSGITTSTTRTLTIPDASTTLVGNDNTQTLTNKTIDGTSATGTNTISADGDDISYDNASSGLTATNVQAAIDEIDTSVDGKISGPGSSTDNALVRYDGATGKIIQNSGTTLDDSGNMVVQNNLTVTGDLTVSGATTTVNTATLDVEDANITVNNNGNDASSEGAGLTVERTGTDGSLIYEDAATSKFKIGALGSEVEIADISSSQTLTNKTINANSNTISNLDTDDVSEGTNLYFTNTRADGRIAAASIDDLSDVSTPSPSDGQLMTWVNANSRWEPLNPSGTPTGIVIDFAGSSAPAGWLLCYGQAVSRTTYSDLFTVLGTTYGVGDGSTTFNLPDLRGRVTAGKDDMGGVAANRITNSGSGIDGTGLGNSGGSETHTLITSEMPAHTHTHTREGGSGSYSGGAVGAEGGVANTGSTGGGGAHQNTQPTLILNKIIKI